MIYIIKHKPYNNPIPNEYQELYVGNMYNGDKENINELNPYINEATGLYDIWKNYDDEVVGMCHYRRFFTCYDEILDINQAKAMLVDNDIIITKEVQFNKGIYEQLRSEIENPDVLDKYYNILIEKEPKLEEWFKLTSFSAKEMFVCKRELLNEYCEWLFSLIIPITEQFIKEDANRVANKRMIGHLVERLFAYWIWKNSLRCYKIGYIDL